MTFGAPEAEGTELYILCQQPVLLFGVFGGVSAER